MGFAALWVVLLLELYMRMCPARRMENIASNRKKGGNWSRKMFKQFKWTLRGLPMDVCMKSGRLHATVAEEGRRTEPSA